MACNIYQLSSKTSMLPFLSRLLLKVVNIGKIVVLCNSDMLEPASDYLWQISDHQKVLPHGTLVDPYPELQLIYLTKQMENPNLASNLVIVDVVDVTDDFLKLFQNILVITMQHDCFKDDVKFSGFNYWKLIDSKWTNISNV